MATLLFIFIILAGYHYFVENVVVPTYRLDLREKLLKLQKRLYDLKIECGNRLPDHAFDRMDELIALTIANIEDHNLIEFAIQYLKDKDGVKQKQKKQYQSIRECGVKDMKNIMSSYTYLLKRVFAASAGGWVLYFSPFVLLYWSVKQVVVFVRRKIHGNEDQEYFELFVFTDQLLRIYRAIEKSHIDVKPAEIRAEVLI